MTENFGHMAELVDALDLGSSGAIRGGSIPFMPTTDFHREWRWLQIEYRAETTPLC